MNWENTVQDLYQKINPDEGFVCSIANEDSLRNHRFSNFWVEFDMNEFMYEDPFYGEQSSKAPFNMFFELFEFENLYNIKEIHQLQNLELKNDSKRRIGCFSNSLHFTIPNIKFGAIEGNKIEFEMKYCLTNSDSYGGMTGNLDDHIQISGIIKMKLTIRELIVHNYNHKPLAELLNLLNPEIYNIENAQIATDTNTIMKDRTQYRIPYKNIVPLIEESKGKWWNLFGKK
jgi:hypothetical protein